MVRIIYIPSQLGEEETGDITFYSDDIGKWFFKARGKGLKPTPFPLQIVHGALNKEFTSNIQFKNPFKKAISVAVVLEAQNNKDLEAFFLLTKRKRILIKAQSTEQIPFGFRPMEINEYECTIKIQMSDSLTWKFPIKVSSDFTFRILTNAPGRDGVRFSGGELHLQDQDP